MGGHLLVCGSVNHDTVASVGAMPAAGETVAATAVRFGLGGKGANQAMAAAALGQPTLLLAAVGADAAGEAARAELRAGGVDVRLVQRSERPTGQALVLLEPSGENRIVVIPGANVDLSVNGLDEEFASAAAVLCQLETPVRIVELALTTAHSHGVLTVLNAAPALECARALLPVVDVLIVNEGEAIVLSGESEYEKATSALHATGPATVVITRGGRGAFLSATDGRHEQPAFPVNVVDTTGAGDCFVGALAQQLLAGSTNEEALRVACAAGALATTMRGAAARPTMAQIRELMAGTDAI